MTRPAFIASNRPEKYLKALLEELGLKVPRTHHLDDLLSLLAPHFPSLLLLRRGLIFLTDFAVDIRYVGDTANKRQAASALRWAGEVRDECRKILGIRPPHRRRKSP